MGKEASKETDDTRCESAKKKSVEQITADEADESSQPPSRVHIFQSKSRSDDSSKSNGQPLQFSFFEMTKPIALPSRRFHGAISASALPVISLRDGLESLIFQIEKGKKMIVKVAMKAEDLEGIRQGLRQTRDRISKRRSRF